MKTFKEFLQEAVLPSNIKISTDMLEPEKMAKDIENMMPVAWFRTKDNPAGFSVHLLDSADKEWFKKEEESTNGVFRIAGNNVLSLVKIDFKTGKVQFFDNKKYEETDKIYWEKPVKPTLIVVSKDSNILKEQEEQLDEVAIQFGKKAYPKFNNVVILAGGAGCFDGNTLVNTVNGYKKIKDITTEDNVLTYNVETGQTEIKEVLDVFRYEETDDNIVELEFDNGQKIVCTDTHRFYIDGEWIMAKDIKIA